MSCFNLPMPRWGLAYGSVRANTENGEYVLFSDHQKYIDKKDGDIEKLYSRIAELERENAELRDVCIDSSDYLDSNVLSSIGHGSILHRKLKSLGYRDL